MKILFISRTVYSGEKSGISVATTLQYEMIKSILGNNCELFKVNPVKKKLPKKIWNYFWDKRYAGMTTEQENIIIDKIRDEKFDIVYIDNSLWGFLAERIKNATNSKLYVFFQDIEYFRLKSIYKNYLKVNNFKSCLYYKMQFRLAEPNEKKIALYADKIINYNKRDSALLYKKYKRKSDNIIPIFLNNRNIEFDTYDSELFDSKCTSLLFVGVSGYEPNIFGVRKFITEVIPYINANLYIIGKGMENYKTEFEKLSLKVNGV